jgi:quinol monooxygenase YgiN
MYAKHGYIKAMRGQRVVLLSYLLKASEGMKEIPECLIYIVGTSIENIDTIDIYEVWTSEASHKASLSNPVFIDLIQKARPIIASIESYPDLEIHGGKGLSYTY